VSWVVDVLITLIAILIGGPIASFALLSAIDRLERLVRRRRALRRLGAPRPSWSPPPLSWSLTLLVRVDEEERLFRPSVQLRGSELPFGARVRLVVVDGTGLARAACERFLPAETLDAEVALPEFPAPEGAAIEDVLGWHWDLVMADWRGERQRWREHPAPVGALNAEAELDLPGVAAT
jgi:hypothetical protein